MLYASIFFITNNKHALIYTLPVLRRDFFEKTSMATIALGLPSSPAPQDPDLIKPRALREGATVALIAPGSPIGDERIKAATDNMAALGLKTKEGRNIRAKRGYLAGTDEQRLADLHWAFTDPEIDAVWCLRGGYGCGRLLPQIDFDLIRRHPKALIGYSDITALHLSIHARTGLVSFHGPVAASEYPPETVAHAKAVLWDGGENHRIAQPTPDMELPGPEHKPYVLSAGKATGPITGGNLSLLAALAGTPYGPSYRGKIVFIEDIGEVPYRIDRMLVQMFQSTDLGQAAGIVLGVFNDCQPKSSGPPSLRLEETLQDNFENLGIPAAYGFPIGHVALNAMIPYGIQASLDTEKGTLVLLEKATT